MAPWIAGNLGKKVTMIFPDFAFGYDHRDYFSAAIAKQGGEVVALIAIPPTETLLHPLFPADPGGDRGDLSRHGRAGRAHLRQGDGRAFYGSTRPQLFGFIDSLEAVDIASPGLEFLEGTHFWEAYPRYAQAEPDRVRQGLPRRRRRRRQRRRGRGPEGRLHLLAHVRLLGDALRHQGRRWRRRLPGRRPTAGS